MSTNFTGVPGERMPEEVDFANVGPAVGTRFPDITLPDQTGALVDLQADRESDRAIVVFHRSAGW